MVQRSQFAVIGGKVIYDRTCTLCPLGVQKSLNTNCMQGHGELKPLLMLVGVSPGTEDDIKGVAYSGPTGRLLYDLLQDAGIRRHEIYVTNAVKCASADPKVQHWKKCQEHLVAEIERVQPAAIVSIGAGACSWLTGAQVTKAKGRSFPCVLKPEIPVYPIMQPAALYHVEGEQKRLLRKEMVDTLVWIKKTVESGAEPVKQATDYRIAKTVADVEQFLAEFEGVEDVCFDLETTGLARPYFDQGDRIIAIGLSKGPGHARAIPLWCKGVATPTYWGDDDLTKVLDLVREFKKQHKFYGFNAILFDSLWDEECLGVIPKIDFDTILCCYLLDENPPLDLESQALRYTDMDVWKGRFNTDDWRKLCQYLCQDVDATSRLRHTLEPRLKPSQRRLMDRLLIPLSWTLRRMQHKGVLTDPKRIDSFNTQLKARIEQSLKDLRSYEEVQAFEIKKNVFFNPDSPQQVGEIMEMHFGFRRIKSTDSGGYCTDDEVLEALIHQPFCADMIEYRQLGRLQSTFVEKFAEKLRHQTAHTSYAPTTVTGRLRSSAPNLTNIPRDDEEAKAEFPIKKLFITRPKGTIKPEEANLFLEIDLSQAELRVLACLSGDPNLTDIFLKGLDAHRATAAKVYGVALEQVDDAQRNNAKRINFGIPYGMGEETLVARAIAAARKMARKKGEKFTGKMAREAERGAREFWHLHQETFPGVWAFMRNQERLLEQKGVLVTPNGRRRHLGKADARSKRQSLNFPIQSLASDVCEYGLIRCEDVLLKAGFVGYPLLTVHDSILFELPESELWPLAVTVKDVMEGVKFDWLTVPMKVDVKAGISWGEMVKLDMNRLEFAA